MLLRDELDRQYVARRNRKERQVEQAQQRANAEAACRRRQFDPDALHPAMGRVREIDAAASRAHVAHRKHQDRQTQGRFLGVILIILLTHALMAGYLGRPQSADATTAATSTTSTTSTIMTDHDHAQSEPLRAATSNMDRASFDVASLPAAATRRPHAARHSAVNASPAIHAGESTTDAQAGPTLTLDQRQRGVLKQRIATFRDAYDPARLQRIAENGMP